jgi:protein ImuA
MPMTGSQMATDSSAGRMDCPGLEALRQAIRTLEGFSSEGEGRAVTLGIPAIDAALGGGLACGALHEIAAAHEAEIAVATGFALALAGRGARLPAIASRTPSPQRGEGGGEGAPTERPEPPHPRSLRSLDLSPLGRGEKSERLARSVLWLTEDMALAESGAPYGPGLDAAGLAPERLITVTAVREREMLWAMEEALRCSAIAAVIGETRSHRIDAVTTRRLSLAAAGSGAFAVLLRATPGEEHSAAATRWIVGAAPGASSLHGLGPPRLRVRLVRNRRGHLGSWTLELNSACFILATHPQPVAGAAFDRPFRADVA